MFSKVHWKIHPGEVLKEEFLIPMKLSLYKLVKEIHVPAMRISDIVNKKRGITVDTALRLSAFLEHRLNFGLICIMIIS